jgi:hypothetical protein
MVLLVPGLLFEFVAFPIWLLARGFSSPSFAEEVTSPASATPTIESQVPGRSPALR